MPAAAAVRFCACLIAALAAPAWLTLAAPDCVDHPVDADRLVPVRAVDGDTVALRTAPGLLPAPLSDLHLRVRGVDCPETHRAGCAAEREAGEAATRFTEAWIRRATTVRVCGWDKYGGRILGDIGGPAAQWLGAELLAKGHARAYDGRGARAPWCECVAGGGGSVGAD